MIAEGPADLICSSKGCTAPARHRVRWNNPKIHTPDRRKIWLACDDHEETLRVFLSARGFYRDTVPVDG
ncbi:MAG TPA: acetone carboxylase [Aeromicrobium sp.]|nr:acetone carboxylase [Aeromicrobium sp.]